MADKEETTSEESTSNEKEEENEMEKIKSISIDIGYNKVPVPYVSLFGIHLNRFSNPVAFLICSFAVFFFYLLYGYFLELIFTLEGMQPYGWFLTLIQFGFYGLFSVFYLLISGQTFVSRIPMKTYFIIAVLTVGTMGFSNSSMGYLNYPTQVIFKSCKLIPVMIGSVLILGKRYSFGEVMACLFMCIGLVWFTLADSNIQPNFSFQGVCFVCLALLCDAIIGNVQEGAIKKYDEDTTRVVLFSYSLGFVIIFSGLTLSGEIVDALYFSYLRPWEVYGRAFLLSAAGFCGVQAVLTLVTLYGALVAVTVTTFRKALSILGSFILFSKPFTFQYIWSGGLIGAAIFLNIYAKNKSKYLLSIVCLQRILLKMQYYLNLRSSFHSVPYKEQLNV